MPLAHFAKLDELILAPPLPAAFAVLMTVGCGHLGWRLARTVRRGQPSTLETCGAFFLVLGAIAAGVHGLALAQLASVAILRPLAWALAGVGLFELAFFARARLSRWWARCRSEHALLTASGKAALWMAVLIAVALTLAALGPPTDADSLDYHLGVPIDWLRNGGAVARPDWFNARLAGLGEALNLLGLAGGTDAFGAVLQAAGLAALIAIARGLGRDPCRRALGALLIAACPVMVFLVPNQKPQLLPAAAVATALLLITEAGATIDRPRLLLALAAVTFAAGTKYTFVLSAAVVVAFALVAAWRSRRLGWAMAVGLALAALLPAQVYARNWVFYGDPLSPFLERFKGAPDPRMLAYASYLKEWGGALSVAKLARLPLELVVPFHVGAATTVLGIGVVAFVFAKPPRKAKGLLLAAGILLVLLLAGGQLTPRFFLEPYLWASMAVAIAEPRAGTGLFMKALLVQGLLVLCMAAFGAWCLFPGAWSRGLRHEVLNAVAYSYAEAAWLDQVLPADARVMTSMRSRALIPRPFLVDESPWLPTDTPSAPCSSKTAAGVTALVVSDAREGVVREIAGRRIAGPARFRRATRNPWNATGEETVTVLSAEGSCP